MVLGPYRVMTEQDLLRKKYFRSQKIRENIGQAYGFFLNLVYNGSLN